MAKIRFVKSVTATAAKTEVQMPWSRGARRAAMIARRKTPETLPQARSA